MEEEWEVNGKTHVIEEQFFFYKDKNDNVELDLVQKALVDTDRIILKMKGNDVYHFITYLPNMYYTDTDDIYQGPWIRGENGLGALSFDRKQIKLSKNAD